MQNQKQNSYRPMVFSRHPTHNILRRNNKTLPLLPFRSVVRLGSTTDIEDSITNGGRRIECNTIQAVKNSSNKLLMKQCFTEADIFTANWWTTIDSEHFYIYAPNSTTEGMLNKGDLEYPIVAKQIFGSRNNGNTLIKSQEQLNQWLIGKTLSNYIFEKFYNYNREYRLHVTEDGCFYTNRKVLRSDTPEDKRWFRNDSNSNWIREDNEMFDKPVNWDNIVEHSVRALKAVGLDVGAVDLRIQSSKTEKGKVRENPDFIIVEINSAPSFGDITSQKYIEQIPKILKRKHN